MKKTKNRMRILFFTMVILLMMVIVRPIQSQASGVSLTFSKGTLRAGDSFTVTLNVALSGAMTVNGSFSSSGPVNLNSIQAKTGSLDVNGNNIFVDLGTTSGISGTKAIVTVNCTVSSNANPGDQISISFTGNYSNLEGDYSVSGSNGVSVAAPLSGNCNLKTLTISNATLSPSFNAGTTSYSAGTVPYAVSSLNVSAAAEDGKSKVSVSGNNLVVGDNTVSVTVKAENGSTKTYSIRVTREQDPNYVPSSNTALSSISVDGFLISPPFQNGVDSYVVWLPYETTAITTKAVPADGKANVSVSGGAELQEGNNTITITCTAEDGTTKDYYIIAKRAMQDGSDIIPEEPENTEEIEKEDVGKTEKEDKEEGTRVHLIVPIITCICGAALGAFGMFLFMKKMNRKKEQSEL